MTYVYLRVWQVKKVGDFKNNFAQELDSHWLFRIACRAIISYSECFEQPTLISTTAKTLMIIYRFLKIHQIPKDH